MSSESVEVKGFYSRRELLHKIAGGERKASSIPSRDRVRRIWPDEPNVGFVEERMAFLVDGAVRIGGPTLKTYDLNADGTASQTRETRLYYDDTYGKLRGSENTGAAIDVFNAVGAWTGSDTATVGTDIAWDTEVVTDSATYSLALGALAILRPGVYRIAYRSYATPTVGDLRVTLTAGSDSWEWKGTGLPTTLTVADTVVYVKTDTSSSAVTLTLTAGTALGDSGALKSVLTILKMR